jgi:Protein of unknown function (DUF1302)
MTRPLRFLWIALLLLGSLTSSGATAERRPAAAFRPAADVKNAAQAWTRAQALESSRKGTERARLLAALPYYLAVLARTGADGKRHPKAPEAAVRAAEIIEQECRGKELLAAKYYLIAAFLRPGWNVWQRAEKAHLQAGKRKQLATQLKKLSARASGLAKAFANKATADARQQAERLRTFSREVSARAEDLSAERPVPPPPPARKIPSETQPKPEPAPEPPADPITKPPPELGERSPPGPAGEMPFELPGSKPRLSGWLRLRDNTYLHRHPHVAADDIKEVLLNAELAVPLGKHTAFVSGEANAQYAASDSEEDAELLEAYLDLHAGDWDLRLGQQVFSWGSGKLFNPTDNLGPWRSVDPLDPQRRGLPAALIRYSHGPFSIEGIYMPAFERTELPKLGQRFFIYYPDTLENPLPGGDALTVNFIDEDYSAEPGGLFESNQQAVRLRASVGTWDVALSYFRGYENIALTAGRITDLDLANETVDLEARYFFPRQSVYGLDLSGWLGKLGLHMEVAFFDIDDTGEDVGIGDQDYTAYVVGAEWSIEDLIGEHDLQLSLEYAGEIKDDEDDRIYINRIYMDALLFRLQYTVDYRLSFEVRGAVNLDNESSHTHLEARYRWSDNWVATLGVDLLDGPEDTFFGAYDSNDRLVATVRFSF